MPSARRQQQHDAQAGGPRRGLARTALVEPRLFQGKLGDTRAHRLDRHRAVGIEVLARRRQSLLVGKLVGPPHARHPGRDAGGNRRQPFQLRRVVMDQVSQPLQGCGRRAQHCFAAFDEDAIAADQEAAMLGFDLQQPRFQLGERPLDEQGVRHQLLGLRLAPALLLQQHR
jgi:hypothetical protein